MVTVKELIKLLLECNMDDEVIVRDKENNQVMGATICTRADRSLTCLFG